MQISGIHKHQIMDIMEMQYGGYDKVGFTTRDYNFCHRNKVETVAVGDAQTVKLGSCRLTWAARLGGGVLFIWKLPFWRSWHLHNCRIALS
jgi:hypothetical protein